MAEAIHSSPAPAPASAKGPLLGTLASAKDLSLHASKAAGGNDHQKGGATKQQRDGRDAGLDEQNDAFSGDQASLGRGKAADLLSETLTIHAAISHRQGSSEAVSLSPAQLSEFKNLLNRQRPRIHEERKSPNAYVVGGLGEQAWFSANSDQAIQEQKFLKELQAMPTLASLTSAIQRPFIDLADELAPQSASEEAELFFITTDPRSGFAPEGVAAWVALRKLGIRLERTSETNYDFVECTTKKGWHVAPARERSARPIAELQAAIHNAELVDASVLIDAVHLQRIEGALGAAVRELSSVTSANQIIVALGPVQSLAQANPA